MSINNDFKLSIASKTYYATNLYKIHSIKPPKSILINTIPITIYIKSDCKKNYESTISYFEKNNIPVYIIDNLLPYVKKAFRNTIFYDLDDYFKIIELLIVTGITMKESKKSYIFSAIGIRSVTNFTYFQISFFWKYIGSYIYSYYKKYDNNLDNESIDKLHQANIICNDDLNNTTIYEIVLCASLNESFKNIKHIASKLFEKIINLIYDNDKKTIIILKSTYSGLCSKIYHNVGFIETSSTVDELIFMYKINYHKPIINNISYSNHTIFLIRDKTNFVGFISNQK